ncbi:MAG: hypothetical protein M5U26_08850 [Planctomycetota bacterium]|nr:hypothetical protein [Planctomycetota bacterium]
MRASILFAVPPDPEAERRILGRLEELLELINMDKEEQAIDPDNFTGNAPDYPDWLKRSFAAPVHHEELQDLLDLEPGDLEGWDFEAWYEDLAICLSHDFKLERSDEPGRWALDFEVDDEHYGGDMSHAWLILAAGGGALECRGAAGDAGEA